MSLASDKYRDACAAVVDQAKARLTLREVWDMAPHSSQSHFPAHGVGVVRSPFREDKPPGNFSVFAEGRAFSDKARADVKGGVWEFVALTRPGAESKEVARVLVERAGLSWPEWRDFAKDAAAAPAEDDAAKAKRLREERRARERAEQARRDQAERERRAARDGQARHVGKLEAWPVCVEARWKEGAEHRDGRMETVHKLCVKRGWPVEWSDMLAGLDLLAFPVEAWAEVGSAGAKRMVAFRVEAPVVYRTAAKLETVGYHQKFMNFSTKQGGWRFLPASKRPERAEDRWSSYERALVGVAKARGVESGRAMVPPLPFVAGCLDAPRLVVILEGQWDALTFMGALGCLHPDIEGPRDVVFFGIRGVNGTQAFVDHWGAWVRAVKPLVWLLPDNDGAKTGGQWFPPARAAERKAGVTYFSERLLRMGARRVKVTPLREGAGGKDFNDYYKAAKPAPAAMWRWMEKLELL